MECFRTLAVILVSDFHDVTIVTIHEAVLHCSNKERRKLSLGGNSSHLTWVLQLLATARAALPILIGIYSF